MTNALEGEAAAKPSLRQEANAQRIGRSRFIGHTVGVLLLVVVVAAALSFAGFRQTVQMGPQAATLPNVWVALGGLAVLLLALLDLGVRRRHDRNRSGVDCAVALMVLAGLAVAGLFGRLSRIEAMAAEAVAAVLILYLVLMLALLPGNRGPNRYGAPPRPDA
jgi:uncharacterized membrane protein YhaH (DUF805 family)